MDPFSRVYKQRNKSNRSIRSPDNKLSRSPSCRKLTSTNNNNNNNISTIDIDLVDKETNFSPYSLTDRLMNNYTLTSFNQPHSNNLTETNLIDPLQIKETSQKTTTLNTNDNNDVNNNDNDNDNDNDNESLSYSYSDLMLTKPTSQEFTSGKYLLDDDSEGTGNDNISLSQDPSTRQSSSYNLVLSPSSLRKINEKDNNKYLEIEGEYIPGLNYNEILDKWQQQDPTDNDHRKSLQNTKFGNTAGSNSNSYKNSSYSTLFKKMHKQNKNSSLALTKFPTWESADEDNEINCFTNNDAYGFDSAATKNTGITIPVDSNVSLYRSNHSKVDPIPLPSLRTLMTPPSELEMKRRISYPTMFNNNNNDTMSNNTNNNSITESPQLTNRLPFSPLKLRTLPSSSALTNQLSSLRRKGSLQLPQQHKTSIDQSSVSSSLTNIPRSFDNIPPLKRETIMEIIDLLPDNFISQPYSQRKKMILKLLPPDQVDNYKVIMSLIKKYMLSSSRSNISLVNSSVPNNSYIGDTNNNNNSVISQTNDTMTDYDNNNYSAPHQNHHHVRHNSIASQYLSTFSPSFVTPTNFVAGEAAPYDTHLGSCVSTTTLPVKPEEKGGQIFNHTMGKIIGFGAWGTIRECFNNETGQSRAIKIVRFKNNDRMKNQVEREVSNWKKLNHPYILPLLESKIDDEGTMYSLTKKIDDGTLYDLIISWDAITNTKISCQKRCRYTVDLAREVIEALQYMHSLNIVHGDIKLENCLLEDSQSEKCRWNLYICDFGMSHDVIKDNPNKGSSTSNIGSLPYASPELLIDNKISYKSDVWAFGVMLYTMLLGKLPFKHGSESKLRELIKSGHFDVEALHFLDNYKYYLPLKDIICGCLEVDISKRWSVSQIQQALKGL